MNQGVKFGILAIFLQTEFLMLLLIEWLHTLHVLEQPCIEAWALWIKLVYVIVWFECIPVAFIYLLAGK